MLFMYYPFRDEQGLLRGNPPTYAGILAGLGVAEVVNQNYPLVEPFALIVYNAFERLSPHTDNNMDPYGQQENDEVSNNHIQYSENLDTDTFETMELHSAEFSRSRKCYYFLKPNKL